MWIALEIEPWQASSGQPPPPKKSCNAKPPRSARLARAKSVGFDFRETARPTTAGRAVFYWVIAPPKDFFVHLSYKSLYAD